MDYSHLTPTNTPIIQVNWWDIVKGDNYNEDDNVQTIEVISVGWLLEDSATEVKIASTYVWREERWSDQHAFTKSPPEIEPVKDQSKKMKSIKSVKVVKDQVPERERAR
ncbi:hypothetical protein KAU11_06745 [Candidatus Babeliales bacterium]|nr:hypothetical protein [Candidatus Babeliales bacterium]